MCLEDTVRIPLRARDGSIRAYALVDAADADWVNQWRWCLTAGYASRGMRVNGRSRVVYLHRELLALTPGDAFDGDHINRNKMDNRRNNLRALPKGKNLQNVSSQEGSTSRHRGVYWNKKAGKWTAQIGINGRSTYLGLFLREDDAAEAARAAQRRVFPFSVV